MQKPVNSFDEAAARLLPAEADIRSLGVSRLAVFGSVLKGTATPASDIDVLVQFSPGQKSYDHFVELSELLERILHRPVELVTAEAISPYLAPRILAEAKDVVRAA